MKIDKKYKWLARDKDGVLYSFIDKPYKMTDSWETKELTHAKRIEETDNTFSFVKWEDEEPTALFEGETIESIKNKRLVNEVDLNKLEKLSCWTEPHKQAVISNTINKPSHYIGINGIDVIGFAEAQFSKEERKGFYRINAVKYLTRYDKKGTPEDDLQKADFYLRKLIELNRS